MISSSTQPPIPRPLAAALVCHLHSPPTPTLHMTPHRTSQTFSWAALRHPVLIIPISHLWTCVMAARATICSPRCGPIHPGRSLMSACTVNRRSVQSAWIRTRLRTVSSSRQTSSFTSRCRTSRLLSRQLFRASPLLTQMVASQVVVVVLLTCQLPSSVPRCPMFQSPPHPRQTSIAAVASAPPFKTFPKEPR